MDWLDISFKDLWELITWKARLKIKCENLVVLVEIVRVHWVRIVIYKKTFSM